jgi:hypothetical protein
MPKSEQRLTKQDFENAFEKLVLSFSTKPTLFNDSVDVENLRQGCMRLISLIEGRPDEEKSKLFSTLAEIILVSRLVYATDTVRHFARKRRVAASRARDAKKTKSQSVDDIISRNLSHLYQKNPTRKKSNEGAAKDILEQVNSELQREQLKPLRITAIAKRIKAIKSRTSDQSSD